MSKNVTNITDLTYLNRHNFRSICNALATPGSTQHIKKAFDSYTLAVASTLLYSQVSFINLTNEDFYLLNNICNAKGENVENADYIFTNTLDSNLLDSVKKGSFKDPEFSASIIFCFDSKMPLYEYILSGAGIESSITQKYPLDNEIVKQIIKHNSNFPMGFEIYCLNTDSGEILALSRTTNIESVLESKNFVFRNSIESKVFKKVDFVEFKSLNQKIDFIESNQKPTHFNDYLTPTHHPIERKSPTHHPIKRNKKTKKDKKWDL